MAKERRRYLVFIVNLLQVGWDSIGRCQAHSSQNGGSCKKVHCEDCCSLVIEFEMDPAGKGEALYALRVRYPSFQGTS